MSKTSGRGHGNRNPNCGGAHCRASTGPVKLRPTGGGGNDILCRDCWEHENRYNAQRVADGYEAENFPQLDWNTAKLAMVDALQYAFVVDASREKAVCTGIIGDRMLTEDEMSALAVALSKAFGDRNRINNERAIAKQKEINHQKVVAFQRVVTIAGVKVRIQRHIDHGGDVQAWLDEYGDNVNGAPWLIQIDGLRAKMPWTIEGKQEDPDRPYRRKVICYPDGSYRRYKTIANAVKAALLIAKETTA